MEVTKVSKEAIEKAEIALGLKKSEEITPVTDAAEKTKQEEIKKAEEAKVALEKEYNETLKKAEDLKAKIGGEKVVEPVIVKAEVEAPSFEKAVNEKFTHLATLINAKNEDNDGLKKAVDELTNKLQKAEEFNAALGRKVGIIEKQPLDRKAVTTQTFIEKGGDAPAGEKGKRVLSLSGDKKEISDILFAKAEVDGKIVNPSFAKASQYVELSILADDANMTKSVRAFLEKEHNIVLTK